MKIEKYKIKAVNKYNEIYDFDFNSEKFSSELGNNEIQNYDKVYKIFSKLKKELNNYKSISLIKTIVTTDEYAIDFENLER